MLRILIATIVAVAVWLPLNVGAPQLWWLESAMAAMLVLTVLVDRHVARPLSAIRIGVSLLQEQDFSSRLARVGQRDADLIGATFNRMIEQLKNERLRAMEQNHFLDMLIAASPAGVIILNYDSTVRSANPAAKRMAGVRDMEGRRLDECGSQLCSAIARITDGTAETIRLGDTRIYRCTRSTFIDSGFQRPFILIESLADEIMKAERSAYGKVIRMIGHEVNNTVAGIVPLFETVGMAIDDPELQEAATSCRERCESLGAFISRYASVVKLPRPELRHVDIAAMVRGQMPFLESLRRGRQVTIELTADGEAPAMADTVLMEQVLVNIVKNSIESIAGEGRVSITVTSAPTAITVADNGAGLSDEAARNIFSPFFSTKEGGQGIGLTIVSEILRDHRCTFSLRTDPTTRLTTFAITFPA